MKKLLLFLLAFSPSALLGQTMEQTAGNILTFMKMEHKHIQDWLNHREANFKEEIGLIKSHIDQMVDLKEKYLEKVEKGIRPETLMDDVLKAMVKLHEKQTYDWREMCDAQYKKGNEIADSHNKELNKYIKTIMPKKSMPKPNVEEK